MNSPGLGHTGGLSHPNHTYDNDQKGWITNHSIYSFNGEKYAFDYNYTKPIYAKSSPRYGKIHIKGTPPIKIRDQ